ncbi:hypothetical protein WCE37_03830 [Luteimonas sp. MJ250]|uniref:hypothetical protein n=1 Tax=Luteimonas sp. MJ250 TaxID=3129236 RepID=UPI0031BAD256
MAPFLRSQEHKRNGTPSMPAVRRAKLLLLAILSVAAPCASAQAGEDAAVRAADTIPMPSPVDEQVLAAVAAVLVATLGDEFGDSMLELTLGEARLAVAGPRDHVVHGVGELRFSGGDDTWLAFRYRTRYDPLFVSAGYPEIDLGADGEGAGERFVPNDAALLGELEARMAGELESLPGAARVFVQLDDISSMQSGSRFLHIEASGIADFGPDGSTVANVEALYDLHAGAWLRINHTLENAAAARTDEPLAGY